MKNELHLMRFKMPSDKSAEELVVHSKVEFQAHGTPYCHFDENLVQLIANDLEFVRGRVLEVLVDTASQSWGREEARTYQAKHATDGNVAAFLVCSTIVRPHGGYACIPNEDARLFRGQSGLLFSSCFYRHHGECVFNLEQVLDLFPARESSVSFRMVD